MADLYINNNGEPQAKRLGLPVQFVKKGRWPKVVGNLYMVAKNR